MSKIKAAIKHVFYISRATILLDKLLYLSYYIKRLQKNKSYRKRNRNERIPPDYFLYETYQLDYEQYINDGDITAKEIILWTEKYIPAPKTILEWGCGVARIIRHMSKYTDASSQLYACDTNPEMIQWNVKNIDKVEFSVIDSPFRINYTTNKFNLIFAVSVLTHLDKNDQIKWLEEIHRLLLPGGIFLFTTHGSNYSKKLLPFELKVLEVTGAYTKSADKHENRFTTTYNSSTQLAEKVQYLFEITEFYNGENNPDKMGGQDLWIARKK